MQVYDALHPGVYLFSAQLQGGDPAIAATAQVAPWVPGKPISMAPSEEVLQPGILDVVT